MRSLANVYREAYAGIRRPVWLLAAVSLVNRAGTMVLPFLTLYLTTRKGFSAEAAGRALALYGLGGVAGSYLGGWLCDRLGAGRVMVGSLLTAGGGFLLLGQMERPGAILAMIAALSLAAEAFRPANNVAIAAASAPGRMAQSNALYRLAINLGMTVGPAAGGLLARHGYHWLFRVDGLTSIAAAALLLVYLRAPATLATPAPPATPPTPATPPAAAPSTSVMPAWPAPARAAAGAGGRGELLRDRSFWALLLLTLLMATVFMQLLGAWTLTLHERDRFTETQVGVLFAINTLVIVLFEMVLVHALSGRDLLRAVGIGSFLLCAGLALLPLGSSFAFVVFTMLVFTLGEMLVMPLLAAVFAAWGPEARRGQALGLLSLVFALSLVIAPLAGTWIYQRRGPAALWYGCGAAGCVLWAGYEGLAAFRRQGGRRLSPRSPACGRRGSSR